MNIFAPVAVILVKIGGQRSTENITLATSRGITGLVRQGLQKGACTIARNLFHNISRQYNSVFQALFHGPQALP